MGPSIQADIVRALRQADSRKRFVELLGQRRIDVVSARMSGDVSTVSPSLTTTIGEVFNGSRMGKEFSANVFNDYFKMVGKHTRKGTGWTFRYRTLAASPSRIRYARTGGWVSFHLETNPRDYEEETFARRMKKKRPDASVAFRQTSINPF